MDDPSLFQVNQKFKLPEGKHPKDYTALNVDVMKILNEFKMLQSDRCEWLLGNGVDGQCGFCGKRETAV